MELIDLYPTLCDLAGLAKPGHVEGQSLVPLLKNPEARWKPYAISRYQSGDTIRTDRYRYTQYSRNGQALGQMLYDHNTDPNENTNIANQTGEAERTKNLAKRLQANMGKPSPRKRKSR